MTDHNLEGVEMEGPGAGVSTGADVAQPEFDRANETPEEQQNRPPSDLELAQAAAAAEAEPEVVPEA